MLACAAMSELDSPETPSLLLTIGRLLFALSVVASGIYQLVTGRYVNLVPVNPARLPPPWQPYLFGVLFVLIGVGLLARRFLVHIPLAINTHNVSEVSRGFQALQDSAVAFMLAGTVRIQKRRDQ